MPVSTRQQTAKPTLHAIDTLWEKLVKATFPLSGRDVIVLKDKDLRAYGIVRTPFDFNELLDSEDFNLSLEPPVLFHPRPSVTLERHPLNLEKIRNNKTLSGRMNFLDYSPSVDPEEKNRGHMKRAREVFNYLDLYAGNGFPRHGIPAPHMNLRGLLGMATIGTPDLFLLGESLSFGIPSYDGWVTKKTLEYRKTGDNVPVHSHLILMTMQSGVGREDSMLMGELAPIIAAMKNRAHQPLVSEKEEEDLYFAHEDSFHTDAPDVSEAISRLPLAFEKETRFPILLVSLVGPQHARLFYACMHERTLVIRQSKLYSFEKKATAPWDFFSRFILSSPLKERSPAAM